MVGCAVSSREIALSSVVVAAAAAGDSARLLPGNEQVAVGLWSHIRRIGQRRWLPGHQRMVTSMLGKWLERRTSRMHNSRKAIEPGPV